MKKRISIAAAILIVVAVIAGVAFIGPREKSAGILYHVTGTNGSAWLLGSIHIGTNEMHPFGDAITSAMADSDVFVFESDTASPDSHAQLVVRQMLPEGTSLQALLGDALWNDVTAAFKTLGLSTMSLDRLQPWAVINTLSLYSSTEEMGVRNISKAISLGIEPAVKAYANNTHKQFAYLETIDEVADTMESFSDDLTRSLLQSAVDVILKRVEIGDSLSISQWPRWWHDGNAEAFKDYYQASSLGTDDALYAEYTDKLLTRRNVLMAQRLDEMLQNGDTCFVTVGLLHLVSGDDNIPALLEDMGYTVTLVDTEE